jgi:hypothetical protein
MSEYRPLNRDQLRAIFEANPLPPVRRLLWEIHRLRAVALRASNLLRAMDYNGSSARLDPASKLALVGLSEMLEGEPVVKEDAQQRIAD